MSSRINTGTATAKLTASDVEFYHREGYVLPAAPLYPADDFAALKNHFEAMLAALPTDARPEAMDVPHFTDVKLFDWLLADSVLDLIEPLLGSDILLFSSHFICKPGGHGRRVPWHEDSAYWKGMIDPLEVVTVWLAIDPSTEANGCMEVIPNTHTSADSTYQSLGAEQAVFSTEILASEFDASAAVPMILAPNHVSLHDGRLIHGSGANTSQQRRCGFTMRYVSGNTRLSADWTDRHQLYLARGKDHGHNVLGDPTKSYQHKLTARKAP